MKKATLFLNISDLTYLQHGKLTFVIVDRQQYNHLWETFIQEIYFSQNKTMALAYFSSIHPTMSVEPSWTSWWGDGISQSAGHLPLCDTRADWRGCGIQGLLPRFAPLPHFITVASLTCCSPPDEQALVEAARSLGIIFNHRTPDSLAIDVVRINPLICTPPKHTNPVSVFIVQEVCYLEARLSFDLHNINI